MYNLSYLKQYSGNDEAKLRALVWLTNTYSEEYDENSNNLRIAEVGNSTEESEYKKIQDKGCCGEVESSYYDRQTKRSFMIGFNYGH
jgi:hypothetical protein